MPAESENVVTSIEGVVLPLSMRTLAPGTAAPVALTTAILSVPPPVVVSRPGGEYSTGSFFKEREAMSKIVVDGSDADLQLIKGLLKDVTHIIVSDSNTEKLEQKVRLERPDAMILDEC